MSGNNILYTGVESIHAHNYTHTTREGYILKEDIDDVPELTYSGTRKEYYNLNPGIYRVTINGTEYAFMIHDTLSGNNKLIIDSSEYLYALSIVGLQSHRVYLYKLHEHKIIENKGYLLEHSVNDALDLLMVDGVTRCKAGNSVSMKYPGELEFSSILNIKVKTDTIEDDYLLNMKNYLKSIEFNRRKRVCDTMYLDRAMNRTTFIFRTARLILTGYEIYTKIEEYSTDDVLVIRVDNPLCKPGGLVRCSHLPTISWENMIDTNYINEGICLAPNGFTRGFYIKVPVSEYNTVEDFSKDVLRWYTVIKEEEQELRWNEARNIMADLGYTPDMVLLHSIVACPVTILYELNTVQYKHLTLDNYKVNTYYNKCWLVVYPYKPKHKFTVDHLDDIVGIVPSRSAIRSIAQQIENSDELENIINENNNESVDINLAISSYDNSNDQSNNNSVRSTDYQQVLDNENAWRYVIHNEGLLDIEDEDLLDADSVDTISTRGIDYGNITRAGGNNIIRNIITTDYVNRGKNLVDLNDDSFVAVIPNNDIIKTQAQQELESGNSSSYSQILAENIIWNDLILTGEICMRSMFFYKHFRLS